MADKKIIFKILADPKQALDALANMEGTGTKTATLIGKAFSLVTAAAITKAFVDASKLALQNYGMYEQLAGGVTKLFGDSADEVMKNAEQAYKTVGMSANEYMDTVTSFSASLISSLGNDTKTAVKYADTAIADMSDNANTFGSDMQSVQDAYRGFSKQNYTMLDNLKLGYGGTRAEMQRLLDDANAINARNGEITNYTIDNFSDIVSAIHVVQGEMGITGTTANEAAKTIEGSMGMVKAAYQDFFTELMKENGDIEGSFGNLAEAVKICVFDNIIPAFDRAIENITGIPDLFTNIIKVVNDLIPVVVVAVAAFEGFEIGGKIIALAKTIKTLETNFIMLKAATTAGLITQEAFTGALSIQQIAVGVLTGQMTLAEAATLLWTKATMALKAAWAANPVGIVLAAIMAVIAAGVILYKKSETFRNFIKSMWEGIKTVLSSIGEFFVSAFEAIVTFFTVTIPEAITTVIKIFTNLPYYIGLAIGMILAKLAEWGKGLIEFVTTKVPEFIKAVVQWFLSLPGKLANAISMVLSTIKEWFKRQIELAKTELPKFVRTFIEKIKELPGKMLNIGKDIVSGIWDGIKAKKDAFFNNIKGWSKSVIKGIKGGFKIKSPSKVMKYEVGYNLVTGIADGLEYTQPLIKGIDKIKKKITMGLNSQNTTLAVNHIVSGTVNNTPIVNQIQLTGSVDLDGVQLGIMTLKNLDDAAAFVLRG